MKLHGYWRSSCSYRVRIALAFKGLSFENFAVHLAEGAQHDDAFSDVNPMRQVPVLEFEHEGRRVGIGQSIAILELLEELHPKPALLPADPIARARVRQLTELVNSGIQPLQNLYVMQGLKEREVDAKAWATFHIRRGLGAYQQLAEATAGRYSVGDEPSFADCALVPQIYNARRFGIDVAADLPLLAHIDAACAELAAFQSAHPNEQPDAEAS